MLVPTAETETKENAVSCVTLLLGHLRVNGLLLIGPILFSQD